MIDDIKDFYNPITPAPTPIVEEPEAPSLDEIEEPEVIEESEDSIDWAVEYDESLSDDSDDFHED
jgi:hypothetical protein